MFFITEGSKNRPFTMRERMLTDPDLVDEFAEDGPITPTRTISGINPDVASWERLSLDGGSAGSKSTSKPPCE
ncbi:MAG: hypothetical protein ACW99F_18310 [Candidatus Hodarchaeales archaeon]